MTVGTSIGLLATVDGGAVWTRTTDPEVDLEGRALEGLSCPSPQDCVFLAERISDQRSIFARTTDGGSSWTTVAMPAQDQVVGVTCQTPSHCVAVGSFNDDDPAAFVSADGGATWSAGTVPRRPHTSSFFWVACPTVSHCVAVGPEGSAYTVDGGITWRT
ncbi:MAG TPA: hypothetical protein VK277_00040 [Acidimicrobiales bacterium]|nr:hypothetical protein [Acidimicrobiales bacterium]